MKCKKGGIFLERKRIAWISGLKGFGCLTVVFLHLLACVCTTAQTGAAQYIPDWGGVYNFIQLTPVNIFFNGSFFVYVFWTLSAYLLTISYNNNSNVVAQEVRKYLRIFINVLIVSVIAFILLKTGLYYHIKAGELLKSSFWIVERDYTDFSVIRLIKEILWEDWVGLGSFMIPPLWTMKTEIIGCLITVLILHANLQKNYKLFAIIVMVLFGTKHLALCCFILGIVLANQSKKIIGEPFFLIGVILGAYPPSGNPVHGMYKFIYDIFIEKLNTIFFGNHGVYLIYTVSASFIILGIKNSRLLSKLFSMKILVKLGEVSMYVYFCHIPVIWSLGAAVFYYSYIRNDSLLLSSFLCFVVSVTAAIIVAFLLKLLNDKCFKEFIFKASTFVVSKKAE